jgi:lipopolysaccharide/colanic/teichoic acid biosynthesis glycosyltransferase
VVSSSFEKEKDITKIIYKLLPLRIEIVALRDFYSSIFQRIPFEEVDEGWFVREIKANYKIYDTLKRAAAIVASPILIIIFSPILLVGAILVKISSKGPVLFAQERTGKDGKPFILYKLRSMEDGNIGPLWTEENDQRVTKIGKFLRESHLDEIPQLFNILKGDISFVGPRAERTELADLYRKLPYYDIRNIIKPGLTGWAQINYKPSVSVEEASEKLSYDIYYVKHRSLGLDILIILKTVKLLFISPK